MTLSKQEQEHTVSAIGDALIETYHLKTLEDGSIMYYSKDEGTYKFGAERIIEKTIRQQVDRNISKHDIGEILYYIQNLTPTPRSMFDANPDIQNVRNGLLNLETGEFTEHSPEYLSIVQLPVEYRRGKGCPAIAKFLRETLDPQQVKIVVKMLGYILLRNAKYEKAFLLVGEGSNGKSVFIKVVVSLVGKENSANVALQELTSDRFASSKLCGKMVNVFADLKADRINDTGYFKTLVSGDRIMAQKKHQQPFEFENYAKLIFSANKIPDTSDDSYAYFRRWVILRFDRTFEGAAKDEGLIDKLTTPEELSGLLNVALGGLKRLKAEHGFEHTDIDEIKEMYREGASKIRDFITEQCILDTENPELTIATYDLHDSYATFCKSRGSSFLDNTRFGAELKARGVERKLKRRKGIREYVYEGIDLKRHHVSSQNLTSFSWDNTVERSSLPANDIVTVSQNEGSP